MKTRISLSIFFKLLLILTLTSCQKEEISNHEFNQEKLEKEIENDTLTPISAKTLQFEDCLCPNSGGFESQFKKSYQAVRVYVLSSWVHCLLCPAPDKRKNAIRVYALYVKKNFKGRKTDNIIYAQAFENIDYCGVKLVVGQEYMLNLQDYNKVSAASHWTKGWYVLDACQGHKNWNSLSRYQKWFLKIMSNLDDRASIH